MTAQLREVSAIAHNLSAPSFENTLVALERSGQVLTRVKSVFFNLTQSNSDPAIEEVERQMAPRLAAHQDAIYLDPALFTRISTLYQQREKLDLDPESRQLLERDYITFVRAGARLTGGEKVQLRQYNKQIATLTTQFQQTVRSSAWSTQQSSHCSLTSKIVRCANASFAPRFSGAAEASTIIQ